MYMKCICIHTCIYTNIDLYALDWIRIPHMSCLLCVRAYCGGWTQVLPSSFWVACSQCGAESKFENCRAGTLGNEACRTCFAPLSFGYSGARLEEVRLNSNKGGGAGPRDAAGKRVKMVRLWDVRVARACPAAAPSCWFARTLDKAWPLVREKKNVEHAAWTMCVLSHTRSLALSPFLSLSFSRSRSIARALSRPFSLFPFPTLALSRALSRLDMLFGWGM